MLEKIKMLKRRKFNTTFKKSKKFKLERIRDFPIEITFEIASFLELRFYFKILSLNQSCLLYHKKNENANYQRRFLERAIFLITITPIHISNYSIMNFVNNKWKSINFSNKRKKLFYYLLKKDSRNFINIAKITEGLFLNMMEAIMMQNCVGIAKEIMLNKNKDVFKKLDVYSVDFTNLLNYKPTDACKMIQEYAGNSIYSVDFYESYLMSPLPTPFGDEINQCFENVTVTEDECDFDLWIKLEANKNVFYVNGNPIGIAKYIRKDKKWIAVRKYNCKWDDDLELVYISNSSSFKAEFE